MARFVYCDALVVHDMMNAHLSKFVDVMCVSMCLLCLSCFLSSLDISEIVSPGVNAEQEMLLYRTFYYDFACETYEGHFWLMPLRVGRRTYRCVAQIASTVSVLFGQTSYID